MSARPAPLRKIISGGQTGVDRAALDAALRSGIDHGGWCPRGRRAEDGPIPARYRLRETTSPRYAVRTRINVAEADATLILCRGALQGGTQLTRREAERLGKPCLVVDLGSAAAEEALHPDVADPGAANPYAAPHGASCPVEPPEAEPVAARAESVRDWLRQQAVATLNVAGPRESQCPGIGEEGLAFLLRVLGGTDAE